MQCMQRDPTIAESRTVVGICLQGEVKLLDRLLLVAALKENGAEKVKAIKMISLRGENLPINFLRLCQSTSFMQSYSFDDEPFDKRLYSSLMPEIFWHRPFWK